jgi:hypothetical protein
MQLPFSSRSERFRFVNEKEKKENRINHPTEQFFNKTLLVTVGRKIDFGQKGRKKAIKVFSIFERGESSHCKE